MKNHKIKWTKWITITTLSVLIIWFAYEVYFKFAINDYQVSKIENQLQQNFHDNKSDFINLLSFSKQISVLENVVFEPNEQLSIQVYDSLLDRTDFNNSNFFDIGKHSIYDIQDINFNNDNTVEIILKDTTFISQYWIIDFQGNKNNPIVGKILSYNKTTLKQFHNLEREIDKINCCGIDINKERITIRYLGHWGESFNYVIPLSDSIENSNLNKLEDGYHWEHYLNGLFCGWTDW